MALTMTRTRTLTTLTRLVKLLATLNGELEFVERLLTEMPEHVDVLTARRGTLIADRDAVAASLRQFDAGLPVSDVESFRFKGTRSAIRQYLATLPSP